MKKNSIKNFCILHCAFSLFIGFFIYLFLRSDTYIHQFIYFFIELPNFDDMQNALFVFLKYYFVDALWCYALFFALAAVWLHQKKDILLIFICCALYGIVWELLQAGKFITGAFDIIDILMYLTADTVAVWIIKNKVTEE